MLCPRRVRAFSAGGVLPKFKSGAPWAGGARRGWSELLGGRVSSHVPARGGSARNKAIERMNSEYGLVIVVVSRISDSFFVFISITRVP